MSLLLLVLHSLVSLFFYLGFTRVDKDGVDVIYHGIFGRLSGSINWFSFNSINDFSVIFQGLAAIFFCYVCHQMVFPLVQDLSNPT